MVHTTRHISNMTHMKISVIVPIYNCENYLGECLDSVLGQTYSDWECICVDDGSTDRSGDIADEYARRDDRFRVVHKPNGGEGSARNSGLDIFTGDWVYFLDSDDILNNRALEVCAEGINNNPDVDISCIGIANYIDGASPSWESDKPITWMKHDISTYIDPTNYGLYVWCAAYRAELVKNKRFTDLKVGADRVFVLDVLMNSKNVVRSNYIGYGYRTREGSIVNTPMTKEKFLADLRHRMFCLELFKSSGKQFAKSIIRNFAKDIMEYTGDCFFRMTKIEQEESLNEWCDALRTCSKSRLWNVAISYRMKICGTIRSRGVLWCLCCLPYWLKAHGVNRKFAIQK